MDNTEFLEQLFLSHRRGLFLFAISNLRNADLAEEAVQETLRIACGKVEHLRTLSNPMGWLVETMKFILLEIEKRQIKDLKLIAALTNISSETLVTYNEEKVEALYQRQMEDPDFRMLVRFSVYGDSIATLAKDTGLSISAVKKRLERTRKKYKTKLK